MENVISAIKAFFSSIPEWITELANLPAGSGLAYTAVVRWVFILLALFILIKTIASLLGSSSPSEVWAYFNVNDKINYPITHWENSIGRSRSSDLVVKDPAVSRSHGTLSRDDKGRWRYMDLASSNGSAVNGEIVPSGTSVLIEPGDTIEVGSSVCTLFPISLEERRNNKTMREQETFLKSPWSTLAALTLFQVLTMVQLRISLGEDYVTGVTISFLGIILLMWAYVLTLRAMKRRGFEMEIIAFFLATLSLAVTSSKFPWSTLKQFIAVVMGVLLFVTMCAVLRNLKRTKALRIFMYAASAALLIFNLVAGTVQYGAANWIQIGGITFQPSEIVKLAYIWVGAASLDELMEKRSTLIFMIFSGFCFVCLALMGDFGTAMIFFVSFLVISFLRNGDFTKLILVVGVAFIGGLMVLRFKSYIAARFDAWGDVWSYADGLGYQQTRTMSAAASGGLVGVGAGGGWLKNIAASETDLVFGFVAEEWGLIIAVLAVLCIITLSIFAVRSIWAGRSTYYTIAACSAMSLFLFQTMLNVFGSVDLFPLTGVTFPFLSSGGTSMVSSWGMLAFLKAADTRLNASIAVASKDKDLADLPPEDGGEEDEEELRKLTESEQEPDQEIRSFEDLELIGREVPHA